MIAEGKVGRPYPGLHGCPILFRLCKFRCWFARKPTVRPPAGLPNEGQSASSFGDSEGVGFACRRKSTPPPVLASTCYRLSLLNGTSRDRIHGLCRLEAFYLRQLPHTIVLSPQSL